MTDHQSTLAQELAAEIVETGTVDTGPRASADLAATARAVVAMLERYPGPGWHNEPEKRLGARMLTARLYRRRSSPGGLEQIGSELGPVYVSRSDPDIAVLLGYGDHRPMMVG